MDADRSAWVQDSTFTPSIWLHPLRADEAGCEAAKGNQFVGTITSYEKKPSASGEGDDHFFGWIVSELKGGSVQVYTPEEGGRGKYTPVPFVPYSEYSIRAPGALFYQLKPYASKEEWVGVPLEVTYMGLKEIQREKEDPKTGQKRTITVKVHQYRVRRDPAFAPAIGMQPVMKQLTGPEGV